MEASKGYLSVATNGIREKKAQGSEENEHPQLRDDHVWSTENTLNFQHLGKGTPDGTQGVRVQKVDSENAQSGVKGTIAKGDSNETQDTQDSLNENANHDLSVESASVSLPPSTDACVIRPLGDGYERAISTETTDDEKLSVLPTVSSVEDPDIVSAMVTINRRNTNGRRNRLSVLRTAQAHVQCLQPPRAEMSELRNNMSRARVPPRLIRLATVTMAPTVKSAANVSSLYFEEPRRPRKVLTWNEAFNARPPLMIDMEGPTPWSYSPRNKPLYETNAPSFTFGSKCSPERGEYFTYPLRRIIKHSLY